MLKAGQVFFRAPCDCVGNDRAAPDEKGRNGCGQDDQREEDLGDEEAPPFSARLCRAGSGFFVCRISYFETPRFLNDEDRLAVNEGEDLLFG
ncbi:MAG: hypothetical protein II965_01275, partial [Pyramidobacter sp.]|nr:hypothetical protein [Pyramidobacter sp.]